MTHGDTMNSKTRSRLDKLDRLAASRCNPHEASLAAAMAADLRARAGTAAPAKAKPVEGRSDAQRELYAAMTSAQLDTMTGQAFFMDSTGSYVKATTVHLVGRDPLYRRRVILNWLRIGGTWVKVSQ